MCGVEWELVSKWMEVDFFEEEDCFFRWIEFICVFTVGFSECCFGVFIVYRVANCFFDLRVSILWFWFGFMFVCLLFGVVVFIDLVVEG